MNFQYYANLFLEFKKYELKQSTFSKYENIVRSRIAPYFYKQQIEDIKPSDVKRWLYAINDVGAKSKRHYLGVLSGIFQEALFDDVINKNPAKMIRLPKYSRPIIFPFNSDEVQKIMNHITNPNFKYYLAIAFYTGMRSGEIIGLKKTDIDFENGIISVSRSRNKHGETTPKTRYSIREVPIINLLIPYLKELYNLHDHEYLFITQYKKPYLDTNVFTNKYWTPALKTLQIPYRRPYNTRHTYATNMLYNNLVTPVQLSQLLGHANTQMVFDVYVKYIEVNYKEFDRSISIYQ